MTNKAEIAQLRFHCRRGMKEIEDLLIPFMNDQFQGLTPDQQAAFSALLNCEDTELWDWIAAKKHQPPSTFKEIVNLIIHHHDTA